MELGPPGETLRYLMFFSSTELGGKQTRVK